MTKKIIFFILFFLPPKDPSNLSKAAVQFTPLSGNGFPRVSTFGNETFNPGSRLGTSLVSFISIVILYGGLTSIDSGGT